MTKPTGRSKTNSKAKRTARRKNSKRIKLRNKLDRVFSWYVRLKDTDDAGKVSCITCGKVQHWLHVDAGHFISRKYMATRWLPVNVKPQCKGCNMQSGGEQWLYSKALVKLYGPGICETIHERATTEKPPSNEQIEEQIEYYSDRVAAIFAERIARNSGFNRNVPHGLPRRIRVDRS